MFTPLENTVFDGESPIVIWNCPFFWDAHTEGETPVPIPNTEVKPFKVDGTLVVRLRESRSASL